MYIKTLQLESVRNLKKIHCQAKPGVNFLYGNNGAGKTSVLEGIHIISRGRSFRPGRGNDWISRTKQSALLLADIDQTDNAPTERIVRLGVERERKSWRARLGGQEVKSQPELAKALPVCLFEPETHQLILGGPEHRRRLLDWSVFHVEHSYLNYWRRYQRSLKQRNQALRDNADASVIRSISVGMQHIAEALMTQRSAFFSRFQTEFNALLPGFSAEQLELSVKLQQGWNVSENLLDRWESELRNDIERGFTQSGPHRADIQIHADGRLARNWLSRGQQKLTALILVLAQQATMTTDNHPHPVMLLDDLESELDEERYQCLLTYLTSVPNQVWLSGVNQPLSGYVSQLFHVEHGEVRTI